MKKETLLNKINFITDNNNYFKTLFKNYEKNKELIVKFKSLMISNEDLYECSEFYELLDDIHEKGIHNDSSDGIVSPLEIIFLLAFYIDDEFMNKVEKQKMRDILRMYTQTIKTDKIPKDRSYVKLKPKKNCI